MITDRLSVALCHLIQNAPVNKSGHFLTDDRFSLRTRGVVVPITPELYSERPRANHRDCEVDKAEAEYSEKSRVNDGICGKNSCERNETPHDEE
jgi:hypothetical protein